MKCDECGRDVAAESVFCPQCGAQLGDSGTNAADGGGSVPAGRFKSVAASRNSGKHPPEEELWSGTYSPRALVGPAAAVALVSILAIVAGAFLPPFGIPVALGLAVVMWAVLALTLLYRRMTVKYRLTTFRLFHESGLLNRMRDRIEVIDINDVTLRQGILERMFNVGTIHIESSDTSDPELDLPGIDNVRDVADLIDNTRRAERQRRAVFMENVGKGQPGVG
jgi:membrane protein YdbS with pleckstrin-like domain